ncbi:unnamed protein product [Amoebophrya sp. A25]|nr:unnamed protein product [Amoebophrya sp. A25]|eukprot:GSA25T00026097001.1
MPAAVGARPMDVEGGDPEDVNRLFIKQVIIHGFKTYKDQTPLPVDFHPGSNIVVGFNGSGKSNFFNAILFVISDEFGQLRPEVKKGLLHEGAGKQVQTAYVEIVFCNRGGKLPIQKEEVRLRRVIGLTKDNYILDGRSITKSEVFNLLESAGFAKNNPYYIVKQGKVQEMTVMTDERRLTLMQEIAGVTVFDERRDASLKKKDEIERRKDDNERKINTMQARVDELAQDQKELMEFQKLDREDRALKYVQAMATQKENSNRLEEIERELRNLGGSAAEARLAELEEEKNELEGKRLRANDDKCRVEYALDDLDKQIEQVDSNRKAAQDELKRAENAKASEEKARQEFQEAVKACEKELAQCDKEEADKKPKLEELNEDMSKRQTELTEKDVRLKALMGKKVNESRYKTVAARDKALKKEIADNEQRLLDYEKKLKETEASRVKLDAEIIDLQGQQQGVKEERDKIEKEQLQPNRQQYSEVDKHLTEMLEKKAESDRLAQQVRTEIGRMRKDADHRRSDLMKSIPSNVKKCIENLDWYIDNPACEPHNRMSELQGKYWGPLLRNIWVKESYRVAAESVLAGNLFHVLVQDDEAGAAILKAVKEYNMGRVECVPLNKAEKRPRRNYPSGGGGRDNSCVPMIDVIGCPAWLKPVVENLVGSWLICKDLDMCARYAKSGEFDCITLEGDKEQRTGIITGGAQKPNRCVRFKLQAALTEVEDDIKVKEEKYNTRRQEAAEKERERAKTQETLDQLKEKSMRYQREISSKTEQKALLGDQIAEKVRKANEMKSDCERTERSKLECQRMIEHRKNEMKSKVLAGLTEAEHEELDKLKVDVENDGQAVKQLERNQKQLQEELANLTTRKKKAETTHAANEANLQQTTYSHENDEKIKEHVAKLAQIDNEKAKISHERELLEPEKRKADADFAEAFDKLNAVMAERQKIREEAEDSRGRRSELITERDEVTKRFTAAEETKRNFASTGAEVTRFEQMTRQQRAKKQVEITRKLRQLEGVNPKALDQFVKYHDTVQAMRSDLKQIQKEHLAISEWIKKIDMDKHHTLLETIGKVDKHFQECFRALVRLGDSRFRVIKNPETGLVTGIRVEVAFTGKKANYLPMNQLSGGQKTVVALALIFAIQRLEPAPFYLFDEIDANLDTMYRSAVASLINREAENCQMILTTFRPELIEGASRFYRVYMKNRTSRVDCVTKKDAKAAIAAQTRAEGLDTSSR